jgi:uncharacterized protein (TIGR03435 family)
VKEWPPDKKPGGVSWGRGQIEVRGAPLEKLAFCLPDTLGHALLDQTGLTGKYEIDHKWTPDGSLDTPDAYAASSSNQPRGTV